MSGGCGPLFGVGVSSAIRWVARSRRRGTLDPDKRAGNTRPHRIDAHRDLILGWGVAARRQAWFATQPDLDPERLVFIDETGTSEAASQLRSSNRPIILPADVFAETINILGRRSGRPRWPATVAARPGASAAAPPVPHGHWKTTTFVGALRLGGVTAPMTLDGAMSRAAFLAYVEQVLVPTLRPGDVVILGAMNQNDRNRP